MPDRIIPIFDSILMSFYSIALIIASFNIITLIPVLFAVIWWASKFKRDIEKHHNGSIKSWLKWLVKKN